jgi:hypothetical protein
MATKPTQALALVDFPHLGIRAGDLVQADPALIDAYAAAGQVDPHKDAVAYAKQDNRTVVVVPAAEPAAGL